jgi:hypothetical protein
MGLEDASDVRGGRLRRARDFCVPRVPRETRQGVNTSTFGPNGDEESEKGVWMAVFVNDVDDVYTQSVAAGLEVTSPQTDISRRLRSRDSERKVETSDRKWRHRARGAFART